MGCRAPLWGAEILQRELSKYNFKYIFCFPTATVGKLHWFVVTFSEIRGEGLDNRWRCSKDLETTAIKKTTVNP